MKYTTLQPRDLISIVPAESCLLSHLSADADLDFYVWFVIMYK